MAPFKPLEMEMRAHNESRKKVLMRWFLGLAFMWVGIQHFVDPGPFVGIVPPYLPWALELVYLSGVFEILGGLGLLIPTVRKRAAWGLVALLVAVYPANIHMLVNEVYFGDMPHEPWLLWARMPFQFLFGLGVVWTGGIWPGQSS